VFVEKGLPLFCEESVTGKDTTHEGLQPKDFIFPALLKDRVALPLILVLPHLHTKIILISPHHYLEICRNASCQQSKVFQVKS
jgi:hypothetical protein